MNINLDDSVKISVKEGAGIERINIRYIRSNVPSKHSIQINFIRINIILNMMNLSANSDKKHQNLGAMNRLMYVRYHHLVEVRTVQKKVISLDKIPCQNMKHTRKKKNPLYTR